MIICILFHCCQAILRNVVQDIIKPCSLGQFDPFVNLSPAKKNSAPWVAIGNSSPHDEVTDRARGPLNVLGEFFYCEIFIHRSVLHSQDAPGATISFESLSQRMELSFHRGRYRSRLRLPNPSVRASARSDNTLCKSPSQKSMPTDVPSKLFRINISLRSLIQTETLYLLSDGKYSMGEGYLLLHPCSS